jgi:DSF synthase
MASQIIPLLQSEEKTSEIHFSFNRQTKVAWCTLAHHDRPCFTRTVLSELDTALTQLELSVPRPRFFVLSSRNPEVFSLGGDLKLFNSLIKQKKKIELNNYMTACIDIIHKLTSISDCERIALVRGNAFGGGFEAALACDTIIAEEGAKFGFPERMFNLFPGMGAYNFLIRRIHPAQAKRLIMSAKTFSAEQLLEMGVIDKIVKRGTSENAVYQHITHYSRYQNSFNAIKRVANTNRSVDYDELVDIGKQWVQCALKLTEKDLGLMAQLERSQQRYSKRPPV